MDPISADAHSWIVFFPFLISSTDEPTLKPPTGVACHLNLGSPGFLDMTPAAEVRNKSFKTVMRTETGHADNIHIQTKVSEDCVQSEFPVWHLSLSISH